MATATAEVRSFPKGEPTKTVEKALRAVPDNYRALFLPGLVDARLKNPDNTGLRRWHNVLTGTYTGKTARGAEIVLVAHVEHYLTHPDNIKKVVERESFIEGAVAGPEVAKEFKRLLKLEGGGVYVIDREDWEGTKGGLSYSLSDALDRRPVNNVISALLGGRLRAETYLQTYYLLRFGDFGERVSICKADDPEGTARLVSAGDERNFFLTANCVLDGKARFAASPLEKLV